jgi:hypothetical protein
VLHRLFGAIYAGLSVRPFFYDLGVPFAFLLSGMRRNSLNRPPWSSASDRAFVRSHRRFTPSSVRTGLNFPRCSIVTGFGPGTSEIYLLVTACTTLANLLIRFQITLFRSKVLLRLGMGRFLFCHILLARDSSSNRRNGMLLIPRLLSINSNILRLTCTISKKRRIHFFQTSAAPILRRPPDRFAPPTETAVITSPLKTAAICFGSLYFDVVANSIY